MTSDEKTDQNSVTGTHKNEEKNQKNEAPASYGLGIRHMQTAFMSLSTLMAFSLRINLSVAIVDMVRYENKPISGLAPTYEWGEDIQGYILSSFFGGYFILQIPAGIITSRFGGHRFLCTAVLGSAALTLVTPQCIYYGDWILLCINRVLQGMCQAFLFPSTYTLLGLWAPPHERSRLTSFSLGGQLLGTVATTPLAALLCSHYGWPFAFYTFGAAGIVVGFIVLFFGSDSPSSHRMISSKEREYIESSLGGAKVQMSVPWKSVLSSSVYWVALFAMSTKTFATLTLLTKIPTYLSTVLKFEMKDSGFLTALPYLVSYILSFFYSWACDFITSRNLVSVTTARKIFTSIAHYGGASCIVLMAHSSDRALSVFLLVSFMGAISAEYSGVESNFVDLAPNFSGSIFSVANFAGACFGLIGPIIIGFIVTTAGSAPQWSIVFYIFAIALTASNTLYIIFGTSETQWWNWPDKYADKESYEKAKKQGNVLSKEEDKPRLSVISRD